MDINSSEMTIENLKQKIENQSKLIKELTTENEELYHQYNHLIIRNGKMLKRVDDLQNIINDLHVRIEEMQLINGNMMDLNDKLRNRKEVFTGEQAAPRQHFVAHAESSTTVEAEFELEELQQRWKSFPGQMAQNGPNLRKQLLMLIQLHTSGAMRATDLFNRIGVGGVTGARYVGTLKKIGFIIYSGARKKGQYEITQNGKNFLLNKNQSFLDLKPLAAERSETFTKAVMEPDRFQPRFTPDQNDL